MTRRRLVSVGFGFVCTFLITAAAWAQGSGIAGVVKDTSGAVMPGVTVEASSPSLIEKVRTVTTDSAGEYKVIDLRPGTYTVTFTLAGFNTVKREGIELTTSFTATVNAELRVGALEETITVSGQSPLVDTQNVVNQDVISRTALDTLPTSKGITALGLLVPGMTNTAVPDVGGASGDFFVASSVHGTRAGDQRIGYDGFRSNNIHGGGGGGGYTMYMNPASIQEVTVGLDNLSAESDVGGVQINVIPKDGGNTYSGFMLLNGTNGSFQSNNLTPQLQAEGLHSVNRVRDIWDINPAFGGRIVRDKLWFYNADRLWGNEAYVAGDYFTANPLAYTYTPDLSKQAVSQNEQRSDTVRLTWQANGKNKVTLYYDNQYQILPYGANLPATIAPDAAVRWRHIPDYQMQAKWTSPLTNKLLIEGGAGFVLYNVDFAPQPGIGVGSAAVDNISVTELSTNYLYRAATSYSGTSLRKALLSHMFNERLVASYVTGSHAFKTGMILAHGLQDDPIQVNGDVLYSFLNGVPAAITERATPLDYRHRFFPDLGLFGQDQWTLKKLTLNLGLRFTYHNAKVEASELPAGTFVPARSYPEVDNVPSWTNLSPRLGANYDLFGDGKTAIKVSFGNYLASETVSLAGLVNPQVLTAAAATRSWHDTTPIGSPNYYIPNCVLTNVAANGDCGALSDSSFGQPAVASTSYDPNLVTGFNKRPDNWETTVGVQHQLLPGVSVNATYFHRAYGHLWVTNNLATPPSDFSPYCVTAPMDPRLPGGGGNSLCGFYDLNSAQFGHVQNLVTFASNYGKMIDKYDGFDATVNARLPRGAFIQGGVNLGREEINNCDLVGKIGGQPASTTFGLTQLTLGLLPNASGLPSPDALFCDVNPPFFHPSIRIQASYPLPWWGLQTSATVQSVPGPMIVATYVATNAQIAPSLGHNLSEGINGTQTVQLIQPGTQYGDRLNQVDLRLAKTVKLRRNSVQGLFDLYNLFNASPVTSLNTRYGPSWQQPLAILQGRLIKLGLQMNF